MWIDISIPLRNGCVNWPGDERFNLTRVADMNRDGTECNISKISTSVHMGTHMDAPLHFVNNGASIETMPLDATLGRCRVIEIKHPTKITVEELEAYNIQKGERILFKTRTSQEQWKTDEFLKDYVYIPVVTAKYLVERGIQTVGVDALSVGGWDDDNAECHRTILGAGIWIIEWLDLSQVEPGDYELACLPLKLVGSEGAPARAAIRKC